MGKLYVYVNEMVMGPLPHQGALFPGSR